MTLLSERLVTTSAPPAASHPRRLRPVPVLVALMAASAALSSFLLLHQSLRLDESQSLWQTGHGYGRMYMLIAQDVHVPLYHTLLHVWTGFFGNGVLVARLLSLIFFITTIPAVYLLARRVFDVAPSLLGAALVAFSPFMVWYGNEIRMYSLLALLTVLNQLFFLRIYQRAGGANWLAYGVTGVAGIYTHYFFWLALITQAVFYLANRRRYPNGTFRRLVVTAGLLVVAVTPWLLFVRSQGGSGGEHPLLTAPTSVDLFNTFSQFLFGFESDHINTLLVALWPLAVLLALLAVQKSRSISPEVGFFLLAGLLPIGAAFIYSSAISPLYVSRYLIIALPSLLLFLTWILQAQGRRLGRTLGVTLLVVMLAGSVHQAISVTTPAKEDYQAATSYLEAHATAQDIVVISPPFSSYPITYYYTGRAAITTLPLWNRYVAGAAPAFDPKKLPAEVASIKADHEDAWLVLSYDQGYQKTIERYYDTHFQRLGSKVLSPGLIVLHYKLRYNIPNTAALIRSLNTAPSK